MRSFLALFSLLVWCLPSESVASASALKGVRGLKRSLQAEPPAPKDKEQKKCKKYKEPKAGVSESQDPKMTGAEKDKAVAPGDKEAGAEKDKEAGAEKDKEAVKGDKVAAPGDTETIDGDEGRRLQDEETAEPKATPAPKDKADPKAAKEAECLEWEEAEGRDEMVDFDSIKVDCKDIAKGNGPTDTSSISFMVNIDIVKTEETTMSKIYAAMEKELQQKVAPRIAGCSSSRFLKESETTKIVHVDFGDMELNKGGCGSSLTTEAKEMEGDCLSSDVPVDVYYVGDFPKNAMDKVEVAIEEHQWDVDGLLVTSEVAIAQTGAFESSMGSSGESESSPPAGMIGGIVAAAVALCCCAACGYRYYTSSQDDDEVVAKAELETDEESDDEKQKVAVVEVQGRRVK